MNLMEDQQAPQSAEGEAKVITLCGSTKFEAEFAEVNQRLTMEGCVVISLGMFSLPDLPDYDWTADSSDLKGGSAACTSRRFAWLTRCTSWIRAAT
jgi:hypothetical protein